MKPAESDFVSKPIGGFITENRGTKIFGLILIIVGILIAINNFDIDVFDYVWPIAIILVGIYLIYRESRGRTGSSSDLCCSKFIGDTTRDDFTGEIDGTDISHFIGDLDLNLKKAIIKPGENRLRVSSFIGDIRLAVPENLAVQVSCSSVLGDFHVLDRKDEGIFSSFKHSSPGYDTADQKLSIRCNTFIGDIKVLNF